jgi:conjugative relaxase-like TrwC/TraI family protein
MTLKKLSAGSGYEYLTRQVAAADSTELGSTPLGDYYAAKGEAPGQWVGLGLVGIDGLEYGDTVTAEQMMNLFGEGCHPATGTALGRAYRADAVAGFDLTFSPVKSVSALWAVAPPEVAKSIEQAHGAAIADAIAFLERHAIFTREGTDGVRQVETRGLIAAAFTHRDSRAGDPDLHTHVAVANKVQTRQGKWLAIYGTVLHQHVVAASEAYNTALEHHLRERLGVEFVETPAARGKRPVREITGVDPILCKTWSSRRQDIEDRIDQLAIEFTERHGRGPTAKESIALAQRANLDTREAKHEPRSEAEQRATWRSQAATTLGEHGVDRLIQTALDPGPIQRPQVTTRWLGEAADRIVSELEDHRATWQAWHMYAEAERQVRGADVPAHQLQGVAEHLVDSVTSRLINLTPDPDPISDPAVLRRSDGTSVYRHTGADHFTSRRILDAEHRIVTAAGTITARRPDPIDVELALTQVEFHGTRLNDGQRQLVQALASDPHRVVLALAPAGSGKTTAMNALHDGLANLGRQTVGLAPSAAAATVLHDATGMPTETLAKLDHLLASGIDPGLNEQTIVIIDEAGMADTPTLDRVIDACADAGAKVCLIGDDQQLAAVGAGGVLRDIATTHGAARLDEIVRFDDPVEAAASLDLRAGDRSALGFYLDHDRVHTGDTDTCLQGVLAAWTDDRAHARESLMLAPTRDLVARLNHAARQARLTGTHPTREVLLADENRASVGDMILTRHNDRRLGVSGTDWVKNGDRWTVTKINTDGSLRARHLHSGLRVTLPSEYVANYVELGYATTVHAAQGSTADVVHGIVTGTEDRQLLYTMLTRGRGQNHVHVVLTKPEDEQFLPGIDEQLTAIEMLDRIIDRDGAATSATTQLSNATTAAARLHEAACRYADAVTTAAARLLGADADDALESAGPGPLPWLPAIPADLHGEPDWSSYLHARADRVRALATEIRQHPKLPNSLARFRDALPPAVQEEVAVWRAANGVRDDDTSLLGPRVTNPGADAYARRLSRRVNDLYPPAVQHWEERIATALGRPDHRDEHILDLARELDHLERKGHSVDLLLQRAAHPRRPLPADHSVEALAYRIQRLAAHDPVGQPTPYRPSTPSRGLGL